MEVVLVTRRRPRCVLRYSILLSIEGSETASADDCLQSHLRQVADQLIISPAPPVRSGLCGVVSATLCVCPSFLYNHHHLQRMGFNSESVSRVLHSSVIFTVFSS